MPQYLVASQHPENYDSSLESEAMIREIGELNEAMDAAGARFFAGGLEAPRHAKSLRKRAGASNPPKRSKNSHCAPSWAKAPLSPSHFHSPVPRVLHFPHATRRPKWSASPTATRCRVSS